MVVGGVQPHSTSLGGAPRQAQWDIGFRLQDPKDRNEDGFVSDLERQAYLLTHAQAARLAQQRGGTSAPPEPSVARPAPPAWSGDSRDTNGDGRVDTLEKRAYVRTHPWAAGEQSVDPMDADGDGVVTLAEEEAYLEAHPELGSMVDLYA